MAAYRMQPGEWFKRKAYGCDTVQWIWRFERPFKETRKMWESRATVRGRSLEIWFNMHPEGLADRRKMERTVREKLRGLFNVESKDICEVFTMLGFTRVAYYCRVEDLPKKELMEQVAGLVEGSYVEAEVNRYDKDTGEFKGTYTLSDLEYNARFAILKHIEGDTRYKAPLNSKWSMVD